MGTRQLLATLVSTIGGTAVLLAIVGACYLTARDNNVKFQRFVTECTANGGSIINEQCINLRDLKAKEG